MAMSLRRRADNAMLRWQARLDTPWADRMIPGAYAVGLFVFLVVLAAAQTRSIDGGPGLAPALQGAWLITEGKEPVLTVSSGAHLLAQQFSVIFYLLAWLTAVLPPTGTLIAVQAAALALGVVPLWAVARRSASLRVGASCALLAVYCLYPTLHNLNLSGFNAETFALPALLGAAYFGLEHQSRWFWACVVVVLASRADLGLALAGLGLVFELTGRRPLGRQVAAVGIAWTVLCAFVLQPLVGDGSLPHVDVFAQYGDSPLSVTWGLLSSPGDVLAGLGRERSFNLFVVLLGPVLFLPVLAPRILVGALPLQALYLVGDVPNDALFGPLTVPTTAFVFVATAFALARVGRMGVHKITVDPRLLVALLLAGAAFFVQDAASSPYRQPWEWGGRDDDARARVASVEPISGDDAVRASPSMVSLLAERRELYVLEAPEQPDARAAADGVDVVVLDWNQLEEWDAVDRRVFALGLEQLEFDVVSENGSIVVWRRDAQR